MPELEPLYTAEEMRAAEARHPGFPGTADELMERAGAQVARAALELFTTAQRWTVVCGGGSNGGDGRIAARHLEGAGRDVRIVDAKAGETDLGDPEVIVDALFGTGFSGEPRADAAALIARINDSPAHVLAVDLPSGVDASTGEVSGEAVRADATVTFHGRKLGLVVAPGRFHAGVVLVADIGLTHDETRNRLVGRELLRVVPRRREGDNKYTAGHVLLVGGSRGLTGAPCLAALSAMRSDAGYVTVAAPESTLPVLEQRLLEAVKRPLPDDDGVVAEGAAEQVLELAKKASAVAIGPGLGRGAGPKELVRRVLAEVELPVVVDADALFELEPGDWPGPRVLTPHEGELGRLLDRPSQEIAAHRVAAVHEAAERFGCVVVLKGPDTLVAAPGRGLLVTSLGLPSLATAGTGDVLTGIVAAFLAKGVEAQVAAAVAAAAQQLASVEASQRAGLIASDLLDALPRVLA
ncbi:MAG: ADP-dependent NAD(P)H-hydrate dehydratase / NAD(P)H-hydrate epimerase [Gaiellaceae bacterium]|jgi:NAD(P)H-hydrate epimerase|nr:ADP-dependent NAD(P)H-hydrate dehydratase / NAD(P)H-hydrate epimerase [Gaiellaceae bacterium]